MTDKSIITPRSIYLDQWVIKAHIPPITENAPIIVMLHGWQGNEDVMWVFGQNFPQNALIISPRGINTVAEGGFAWADRPKIGYSTFVDFKPSIEALYDLLALRPGAPNRHFDKVILIGFSQGAALAYAFALQYPERVCLLAGLAGFVPEGIDSFIAKRALSGIPVFISHGTNDLIVSIERARQDVAILEQAGANVNYCEDEVGHKLSAACLRALEQILISR